MAFEGEIQVELGVQAARVSSVRVSSSRRADASRTLVGLPVELMLESVPLLFSVCGEAQSVAAREASEAALGIEVGEATSAARQLRVACEAIDNQALQVALGWPTLFGRPPVVESLRALRAATAQLRHLEPVLARGDRSGPVPFFDQPSSAELQRALSRLLEAPLPADPSELEEWTSGPGVAQHVIGALLREGVAEVGRCEMQMLPALSAEWFEEQARADASFEWTPRYRGLAAETGALARTSQTPLISALLKKYGNGLLTRFVARVADLEGHGARVVDLVARLRPTETPGPPRRRSGTGAAVVDTSRGRLAHVLTIEDERVTGWRVVAPTEWNFHPEGPLFAGLEGVPAAQAQRLATLLVSGLDPCVGFHVTVRSAAHA
jgi:coenzyme F420-reducing hydrogenase alpha subunit